jgi:hypothetical protein
MHMPRGAVGDREGERVDPDLPFVVDAHVHLFPDAVFEAIWRWFDAHGWPVRYKLGAERVVDFLLARGVGHLVALTYSHKPGMARTLNAFMAKVCRDRPRVTGLGTVLPGEPDARSIVEDAFAAGLRGIKLHCHVQCFSPDDDALAEVYDACVAHDRPVVIHAGREPKSSAYRCDPYALCSAERTERVLRGWPRLRLCVPHLGADELDAYERLLAKYDNLWLDTTMMLADYFPVRPSKRFLQMRPERIMYGTDFPNLPFAWDREITRVGSYGLNDEALARVLGETARGFYGIPER